MGPGGVKEDAGGAGAQRGGAGARAHALPSQSRGARLVLRSIDMASLKSDGGRAPGPQHVDTMN